MAKKSRAAAARIPVTAGSGNVFADLGVANPEEELAKAQLAAHLRRAIRSRKLTQARAAAAMGLDQPKVSAIVNGRLGDFSSERLMRLLIALGHDVTVVVAPARQRRARGHFVVRAAA